MNSPVWVLVEGSAPGCALHISIIYRHIYVYVSPSARTHIHSRAPFRVFGSGARNLPSFEYALNSVVRYERKRLCIYVYLYPPSQPANQ